MRLPKISIITISYNSQNTIERTIQSVLSQNYENLEYIIIDGKSTDCTMKIIEKYIDRVDILISEKDNGISDAFNKGIMLCTGDIIGIINSDDYLEPNALMNLASAYNDNIDVYRCNIFICNPDTGFKCREIPSMKFNIIPFFIHVSHQGTFVKRSTYNLYGMFDVSFRYMMDLDFLTRCYKEGAIFKYVNIDVATFNTGGVTNDILSKKRKEILLFIRKNGGNKCYFLIYYYYLIIISLIKKLLDSFGKDLKLKMRYKIK